MNAETIASFSINREEKLIRWSSRFPDLLGRDDLHDQSIYQLIASQDHQRVKEYIDKVWQGQQAVLLASFLHQSGTELKASLDFVPMFFQQEVSEIQVFARVMDTESLPGYCDETVYRLIAENTNDLIAILDPSGSICYASPSHYKILGYIPEQFQGTVSYDYIHPEDRERVKQSVHDLLVERNTGKTEFRIRHRDGHWIYLECSAFPIYGEGEECEAVAIVAREITERKMDEEKIQYLAYNDPLTELPNRLAFRERLEQAITNLQENVAVLFLDIDRFKIVNDALGHPKGELLLKDVGQRIARVLRPQDLVARIAADEFSIILPDVSLEEVMEVSENILHLFHEPFYLEGHEFFITATIGISMFPQDGTTVDDMVRNSNTAMFQAKLSGGNQYQFYTPAMNRRSVERLLLENSLRRALDKQEFEVYYQPQVDLASGRIMGLEALIRWKHPQMGFIPPSTFIPLAEETGLILSIGEWVLRTACRQIKDWHDAGLPRVPVSVNLSPRQFLKKELAESIRRILEEAGLEPEWLELEITESVLMQNSETNIAVLREFKKMGIRISIDDFGTGYSSLGYLKRFPIDCLKIDQSFVRDMTTNREDAAIATAIISLAHNLDMKVIAEGIETEEQALFLRSQRCNAMQGYLFSPPLPTEQCESLLEQEKVYLAIQKDR